MQANVGFDFSQSILNKKQEDAMIVLGDFKLLL